MNALIDTAVVVIQGVAVMAMGYGLIFMLVRRKKDARVKIFTHH